MKFSKGKSEVLHRGGNNPMHQYRLGTDWPERNLADKGLVDKKLNMKQQCAIAAKNAGQKPPGLH